VSVGVCPHSDCTNRMRNGCCKSSKCENPRHNKAVKAKSHGDILMRVGLNLRNAREIRSIPIKTVADWLGVNIKTVSSWELGDTEMTVTKFLKYCEVIGCNPGKILS